MFRGTLLAPRRALLLTTRCADLLLAYFACSLYEFSSNSHRWHANVYLSRQIDRNQISGPARVLLDLWLQMFYQVAPVRWVAQDIPQVSASCFVQLYDPHDLAFEVDGVVRYNVNHLLWGKCNTLRGCVGHKRGVCQARQSPELITIHGVSLRRLGLLLAP